jgi:hypothetical protein
MRMDASAIFFSSKSNLVTLTFAGAESLDKAVALEQKVGPPASELAGRRLDQSGTVSLRAVPRKWDGIAYWLLLRRWDLCTKCISSYSLCNGAHIPLTAFG